MYRPLPPEPEEISFYWQGKFVTTIKKHNFFNRCGEVTHWLALVLELLHVQVLRKSSLFYHFW